MNSIEPGCGSLREIAFHNQPLRRLCLPVTLPLSAFSTKVLGILIDLLGVLPTIFSNQDVRLAQALPERWAFMGREEELDWLEKELGFQTQPPLQKSVVALWGLSGVGKSQLASRFVNQQRCKHPEREIFWISGESGEAFEQSVINMLKVGSNSASPEIIPPFKNSHERMRLINSFFAELNGLEDPRWLLVIDGINGMLHQNPNGSTPFDIHSYVTRLKRGYILLVARRRDMVERYHPNREVKGLKDEDAVNLLKSQVDPQLTEGGGTSFLAFKCCPCTLIGTDTVFRCRRASEAAQGPTPSTAACSICYLTLSLYSHQLFRNMEESWR